MTRYRIKDAGNSEEFNSWDEVLQEFKQNYEMWGLKRAPTEEEIENMMDSIGDIQITRLLIYTIKTDAEMYDIEAKDDEEAIKIARDEVQLSSELIANGAWLRVFLGDYPIYYEGKEVT